MYYLHSKLISIYTALKETDMSKYNDLKHHLMNLRDDQWETSFEEIENLLGFSLPNSAYKHPAWWSNTSEGHSHAQSWLDAGWQTSKLNLKARKVCFLKMVADQQTSQSNPENFKNPTDDEDISSLDIKQAKAGLAKRFGVPVDSIEITIKV